MSGNVSNNNAVAAEAYAENLAKYPEEVQLVLRNIMVNCLNGCSWEFIRENPEVKKYIAAIRANKNLDVLDVVYNHKANITGYLLYADFNYAINVIRSCAPNLFNEGIYQKAEEHRKQAISSLIKLMKGKYKGRIGIYCTNDSQAITIDGKTYPAFAVSLPEFISISEQLNYGIANKGGVTVIDAVKKNPRGFIKALTVAPSSNAIFINIAPTR